MGRSSGVLACVGFLLTAATVGAFVQKKPNDQLDLLAFQQSELRVVETNVDADSIRNLVPNIDVIDDFRAQFGGVWHITLDQRRGVPTLVGGGAIPMIPGGGNTLQWDGFAASCRNNSCIPVSAVEPLARDFLRTWKGIFQVEDAELVLDPEGSGPFGHMYYLRFRWLHSGIPVERGSVFFRLNRGNLIQIATSNIGPISLDPTPSLDLKAARSVVSDYLGPFGDSADTFVDKGTLTIIPTTPAGQDPDSIVSAYGAGLDYRLVWQIAFVREGVTGTWQAMVDAHTGKLLRFVDLNRYGRVHGGAYPGDNHTGEADRPFAFVDIGGGEYSDAGGLFPGDSATVTLRGRYAWVTDGCGPINGTTSDGDVDFMTGPLGEQDCAVPVGNTAGAGNTHSARTQYYHVTSINTKARSFLPGNTWLNNDHMNISTNGPSECNAGSGGGTIYFYKSASGCWNLGELPAVSLHEWGHSMDDFDGSGGDSPPVETRADWTAMLQTHDSCVGRGFFLSGSCSGYGDDCLDCSGVRDNDWNMHVEGVPWTPANHGTFWSCPGGSYFGPCGLEDHCEAGLSTQALWDFVTSDAVAAPTNLDLATAWALADRLFYLAMPTLGNLYSCSLPTSDGCNGGGLYATMMAIDDDGDGTGNGTPHAAAVYAALARHNIACGAVDAAQNQNQSSCPSLATPTMTLEAGSNSATVNWGAIANAQRYLVYRNDIGCDAGFTKVGDAAAPATSFVDTSVVNGIPYYYRLQAVTDTDSCASHMSTCGEVTPQPCAGSVSLDRATYTCSGTVNLRTVDSDLTGVGTLNVTAWSDSEAGPETIGLVESPPASGIFVGSFATSSATTGGDGMVGVVDGDEITVRYHDDSFCGPAQDVDATAFADCVAPVISSVVTSNVTGFSADVDWLTNEPADSRLDAAPAALRASVSDGSFVTVHGLTLKPLAECTEYSYTVTSTDPAGNIAIDDNSPDGYTFRTLKNTVPTYDAGDTPVSIPDNSAPGATSVITVADDKAVIDLDVLVDITHTYDGDISLHLEGPNSVEIVLANRRGSGGDNFTATVFDDEATTPIASGTAPFTGSFQPEDPLTTFDGVIAAGAWTLRVEDHAGSDIGTIDSFALTFTFAAETCPTSDGWVDFDQSIYGCSSTITITVQDQDLEGTGSVAASVDSTTEITPEDLTLSEVAPGVFTGTISASPLAASHGDNALSIATGDLLTARYVDANDGVGGHDVVKSDTATGDCDGPSILGVTVSDETGSSAVVSWSTTELADTTVVWDATRPPVANSWHDDTMAIDHLVLVEGLNACSTFWFYPESTDAYGNTVSSTNGANFWRIDTVAENGVDTSSTDTPLAISDNATLTSTINLPSTLIVTDVDVRLNITHTYDADLDIFLVGPNGTEVELTTDNGSAGDNFTDTVFDDEAATDITAGTAPFAGSYRPEGSLATLDGIVATGDWALRVTDDAGGDTGSLNSWSIVLTLAGGECVDTVFSDGFEGGSMSAWSTHVP